MKLARKLQLAYLALMVIPFIIMGTLAAVSYYSGGTSLGLYSHVDAPGWIKSELAAILDEDWERYGDIPERLVVFVIAADGNLLFPRFSDGGLSGDIYPHRNDPQFLLNEEQIRWTEDVSTGKIPASLSTVFDRFGTEWTMDLTFSPVVVGENRYLAAWREPIHGIPGFISRKGFFLPLLVLSGILFIPALIDARLRRSIRRLQAAAVRLASGELDEPIEVLRKDDLSELAATLEKTRQELKDARNRRSRLLMAVSHDLRTPLTSIKGYVEALDDGMAVTPEDHEKYLAVLNDKTGLLESRIDELIDFARSETGGWSHPVDIISLVEFFGNLDASFSRDCGFSGRNYSSEITVPDSAVFRGDAPVLYRAWENLMSNALRYTDENDSIAFRVVVDPGAGNLYGEVEDSGVGVSPDFVPHLFEAFARADRGRNAPGLGLGLASVKAVAEGYGGSVSYRPAGEGGSVFRITLPLNPADG